MATKNGNGARKVLTRADFDALAESASDLPIDYVHVPEWAPSGVDPATVYVCIQALPGYLRDRYESSLSIREGRKVIPNMENARARLVALCMIDPESSERLYSDREIEALGKRSAKALDRVWDACRDLSGLRAEAVEEEVEELKNAQSG
jgi:hypothetical protein